MEIEYLRCVWAVFHYKSFSEAAYQLSRSQSTVSKNVAKIEDELNIRLFERAGKNVYPTSAGEGVLQAIEIILREEAAIRHCVQIVRQEAQRKIIIGSPTISKGLHIGSMIASFAKENPQVEVEIIEDTTYPQISALLAHKVDIAIATQTFVEQTVCGKFDLLNDNRFVIERYYRDRYYVVVNKCHPLSGRPDIDIADLADEHFVMIDQTYEGYHEMLSEAFCRYAPFKPKIAMQASGSETVLDLVEKNVGITILTPHTVPDREPLVLIPLRQSLTRETMVVALRQRRIPKYTSFFLRYAKQNYTNAT